MPKGQHAGIADEHVDRYDDRHADQHLVDGDNNVGVAGRLGAGDDGGDDETEPNHDPVLLDQADKA
jgi:hypothetical protein